LLFIHGFLGNSLDWKFIAEIFSADYYCLSIDLPGHGFTKFSETKNSFSVENTAYAIIDLLQNKNIKTCNLIGYSMGGRVAFYLAIYFPQFFNKIVIESAQPGIDNDPERELRKKHDFEIAQKIITGSFEDFLGFWYDQPIFKSLKKHKNFANLLRARLKNNPNCLAKALKEVGVGTQPSLWKDLHKIKSPCLLIAGEFDTKYQRIFSKVHKEIFSSYFVIIKNAGHNVHFENTDEFIKVVKKFLR
jgi:2-succinyl-6-hydroxy-2,4-cyclohexadiene-1-carboxylate synthase